MKFAVFHAATEKAYREIPERFKAGIEGLIVSRDVVPSPGLPEVYTLGECLTESWPSDWQGPDTIRSSVVLYWGSFESLSEHNPEFDWDDEIWETLTHELRHHLESLADENRLEEVDYAMDQGLNREEGQVFDPWYYQSGDPEGTGTYRVEEHLFLEQQWSAQSFENVDKIPFQWHGCNWFVRRPEWLGDVHFVWVNGVVEPPEIIELVLVRKRSWWETVTGFIHTSRTEVVESEADGEKPELLR